MTEEYEAAKAAMERANAERIESEVQMERKVKAPIRVSWHVLGYSDIIKPRPPRVWDIKGLIAARANVLIQGAGGIGKSYFVIYAAVCLAMGRVMFPGKDGEGGTPCRKIKVLFISGEMNEDDVAGRIKAVLKGLEPSTEEMQDFKENFRFVALPDPPLRLNDPDSLAVLMNTIWDHRAQVVILDHLNATKGDARENSDEMGSIIQNLREYINKRAYCSPWVVHHERKSTPDNGGDVNSQARGHSSIKDNSDIVLQLSKPTKDKNTVRYVISKSKYSEEKSFFGTTEIINDANGDPDIVRFIGVDDPTEMTTYQQMMAVEKYLDENGPMNKTTLIKNLKGMVKKQDNSDAGRHIIEKVIDKMLADKRLVERETGFKNERVITRSPPRELVPMRPVQIPEYTPQTKDTHQAGRKKKGGERVQK